jgi:hypothetical protein
MLAIQLQVMVEMTPVASTNVKEKDGHFCLYMVARFGFVVYLQTLYNVMSVIYLQENIIDPRNYIYGLTWTWHLTMNPQCFAQNKDPSMLLVYLSSF